MFSDDVAHFLTQHLGTVPYMVLAFSLLLVVPALLSAVFVRPFTDGRCRRYVGLLAGLAVAVWASLCWLVVPYAGGYPCLPGLVVTMLIFRAPPIDTLPEELLVHAVNFVLWPAAGWQVRRWCYRAQVTTRK